MSDLLAKALHDARFDPPENICASCGHDGGDHDLGNWCLLCPRPEAFPSFSARSAAGWDFFSSMTEAERWAHGATALRNHPDRLRIAASLLTVEDVAEALHYGDPIGPRAVKDFDTCPAKAMEHQRSAAVLAALVGEPLR
jgi:hypothetical protein